MARCSSRRCKQRGRARVVELANSGDPGRPPGSTPCPTAEFIGKQLKGGKAEYAGEGMQDQPRKFGVIYSSNFDIDFFKTQLKKYGVPLASEVSYTVAPGTSASRRTARRSTSRSPR